MERKQITDTEWMNSETVLKWATQQLAERQDPEVDALMYQHEQLMDPQEAFRLAPSLEAKILEVIEGHEFSSTLKEALREEMENIVEDVVDAIPEEEAAKLGDASARAVRERDEQGRAKTATEAAS